MAQHDYVIDNQASASARADLNSLFQAIASQNSGATAPATTYANMMWYDTATDLLKMRNEANTAWITLGTSNQALNTFTAPSVNGKTVGTLTAAGGIAYATSTSALAAIGAGTAGQSLLSGGAGAPTWGNVDISAYTLLGTLATTSGTTQTLSGLNLTTYKFIVAIFQRVSANSTPQNDYIRLGPTGPQISIANAGNQNGISGVYQAFLQEQGNFSITVTSGVANTPTLVATTYGGLQNVITTASTSISFTISTGPFDGGLITIYGGK